MSPRAMTEPAVIPCVECGKPGPCYFGGISHGDGVLSSWDYWPECGHRLDTSVRADGAEPAAFNTVRVAPKPQP